MMMRWWVHRRSLASMAPPTLTELSNIKRHLLSSMKIIAWQSNGNLLLFAEQQSTIFSWAWTRSLCTRSSPHPASHCAQQGCFNDEHVIIL
jgi:hypothetical protein